MIRQRPVKTPIFDALASRYNGRDDKTPEEWALGAYMRGFTYGLVLQEVLSPPRPVRVLGGSRFHYPPPPLPAAPSPWDAIDATPNEHDPNL